MKQPMKLKFTRLELLAMGLAAIFIILDLYFLWGFYKGKQQVADLRDEYTVQSDHLTLLTRTSNVDAAKAALADAQAKTSAAEQTGLNGAADLDVFRHVTLAALQSGVSLQQVAGKSKQSGAAFAGKFYSTETFGVSAVGDPVSLNIFMSKLDQALGSAVALDGVSLKKAGTLWALDLNLSVLHKIG